MSERIKSRTAELPLKLSGYITTHVNAYINRCAASIRDTDRKPDLEACRTDLYAKVMKELDGMSVADKEQTLQSFFIRWEEVFAYSLQTNPVYEALDNSEKKALASEGMRLPYILLRTAAKKQIPQKEGIEIDVDTIDLEPLCRAFTRMLNDPRVNPEYYDRLQHLAIALRDALPHISVMQREKKVTQFVQKLVGRITEICAQYNRADEYTMSAVSHLSGYFLSSLSFVDSTIPDVVLQDTRTRAASVLKDTPRQS